LRRFFLFGDSSRIRPEHREKVSDILARLDASTGPEDMDLPGFRLHALKGDLAGYWSVTVRSNWRIVFGFEDEAAVDVDYLDYH
jgi:proteic killer suppression protein